MSSADAIESARGRIEWTRAHLPMLRTLQLELLGSRPFEGLTIGVCLHIEPKTAVLCSVLAAGGARVAITGSPGTTQDDVAAALASSGCSVHGQHADGAAEHARNVLDVLGRGPDLLLDNGADLVAGVIELGRADSIRGATEETTTGALRLREELAARVPFPVIVINDCPLKRIVENQYGVGHTVVQAFMAQTNLMVPGKRFVVFGYGWCGRGVARTLRALGAQVAVVEPDATRALEAALDGMKVSTPDRLSAWGEVFFTVTGRPGVLRAEHFERMRDGAILANAGHFSCEIDLEALRRMAVAVSSPTATIRSFALGDGRTLSVLAGGEMLNLAAGGGNPTEAMDLGLSLQARSLERLALSAPEMTAGPRPVPDDINQLVARATLDALGAEH